MEGLTLEVLQKSCLVELIGACLQKVGSRLQVDFLERYVCLFLDICIPTLKYIQKQDFKIKDTYDLLIAMPALNTSNEKLDTVFIRSQEQEQEQDYSTNLIQGLVAEAKQQYQTTWLTLLQKVVK